MSAKLLMSLGTALMTLFISSSSFAATGLIPIPQGAKFCHLSSYNSDLNLSCGEQKSLDVAILDAQESTAVTAIQLELETFVAQGFHIVSCSHTPGSKEAYERWDCFVTNLQ